MRYLDLTLPTPEANLALDEALLEAAETTGQPNEVLRVWEPDSTAVIVGRSSQLADEVELAACRDAGVPVLRRTSGGAAVVIGPGCLMYALVLSYEKRPVLRAVDQAHRVVLGRIASTLRPLIGEICCRGTSDLALGLHKCSGNSVRCKRTHLLYHGTLLYDFPASTIEALLKMPPRQPEYRDGRSHGRFVVNLPLEPEALRRALREAWGVERPLDSWPEQETSRLITERYGRSDWNRSR
jgi:lipoate-protein ligase A